MDKIIITERPNDAKVYDMTFDADVESADFSLDGVVKYSFSKESDKVFAQPPLGTYQIAIWYRDEEGLLQLTNQTWIAE